MAEIKLTPMMKQYQGIKAEIPEDAILLFRLGDFYEMFFDDAKRASKELDIVYTQRQGVPMCGVPYHALENYLPRLLEAGLKVAIAEQVEDPKLAKGIVKREVTRIITPGTVIDSAVLSPNQSNFLVSLTSRKERFGLACLEISTGDFRITELANRSALETELHRLHTRECLVPESLLDEWKKEETFPYQAEKLLWTPLQDWIFATDTAEELLKRHFQVASLDGFGCRNLPLAVAAAGAVLHYASDNLRQAVGHIRKLRTFETDNYLVLDYISQRNLELVEPLMGRNREGTLLHTLDHTVTPMGSRMLREWILRPLRKKQLIAERLDAVDAFKDDPLTLAELREVTGGIRDLERIITRLNVGTANARDIQTLSLSLGMVPDLKDLLKNFSMPLLSCLHEQLHSLPELAEKINATIADDPPAVLTEGGIIRDGANSELDEFRKASTEGKSWLATLQAKEQERSGIKSLKVKFNKVFGYYIEVSKANLSMIPDDYIRKQTLVNAERFITPELKEIESKILGAEDKAKALEHELFQELREFTLDFTPRIQETAGALAAIDVLAALAECARKFNYCRPHIREDELIDIKAGRHPVLDAVMESERFVPNDLYFDGDENRMMIITGPNMAGKSTYIRQAALLVLMAQMGSFIPAESATVGIADRIFTRVGAADDIARGQSTFMVEMVETANILNHVTSKSLVILDEIGRGTSTFDGLSIAWAVAEYLHDHPDARARTMFATHYHELTELALTRRGVKNYNVAVREYGDQVIFLRQIIPGGTDKSYGIHVAKLAGLPDEVVVRANEILENLENNSVGEAGQPALAIHHVEEEKAEYPEEPEVEGTEDAPEQEAEASSPEPTPPAATPEGPFQPSLFD